MNVLKNIDDAYDCCECGNTDILVLGECKQCWEKNEQLEVEPRSA